MSKKYPCPAAVEADCGYPACAHALQCAPPGQRLAACPACNAPASKDGQPSRRIFFGCGSYAYEGDTKLTDQTALCEAWQELDWLRHLVATVRDKGNLRFGGHFGLLAFAALKEEARRTRPAKSLTQSE